MLGSFQQCTPKLYITAAKRSSLKLGHAWQDAVCCGEDDNTNMTIIPYRFKLAGTNDCFLKWIPFMETETYPNRVSSTSDAEYFYIGQN